MANKVAGLDTRREIVAVRALDGRRIEVVWNDALTEVLDLTPLLVGFMRRPVAQRELLFRTVTASPTGRSITWADGSELGIDWLRELALGNMSNSEFRLACETLGLMIEEVAGRLGVSNRSIAGYRRDRPVPRAIALAVRFLLHRQQAGG